DNQSFARFEMRVEAAVRETHELHQIGHAQAIGAGLTQAMRGFFDDPAPGLQPMALHVAHDRLSETLNGNREATRSILISPFFSKWAKLGKERPCRAILVIEVPQFIGDCGWLDKELVGRFAATFAHSRP